MSRPCYKFRKFRRPEEAVMYRTERLFVRTIQILVENLGHGEHMHSFLFENSTHCIVASDLASVTRIL